MPLFQYKGFKNDGSKISGTVEANSVKDAILKLKEIDLYPVDVSEVIYKKGFGFLKRSNKTQLVTTTRQLSVLLNSGVPLIEALNSIIEESRGYWKHVFINIRDAVAGGSSFARALEEYSEIFPEYYINMVSASEVSGTLDVVLKRLADYLESQDVMQSKVKVSMVYPVFMIFTGFIVMSFLFSFVIPKIISIFKNTQASLPFITVILIKISDFFKNFWWFIAGIIFVMIYLFKWLMSSKRVFIDKLLFRLPGNIFNSLYYSRFTRTLGFLLTSGLPVLKSLEMSGKATGNKFLEERIQEAQRRVAEGARLSSSLEGLSPFLIQLISTGEKSGRLSEILTKAGDTYEEEFSRSLQKFVSLLEPSMILIMGVIVGFIVLAILLPIFQLNQLIK